MKRFEHDCPDCRCPNPTGPQQWMAARLTHTPHPNGFALTAGQLYGDYIRWETRQIEARPVFSQVRLTRWLRQQGMDFHRENNTNTVSDWSFKTD